MTSIEPHNSTLNDMTPNYYIQTYRLSSQESEDFQEMAARTDEKKQIEPLRKFANRWMTELRQKCDNEAACRAVMFRYVLDISFDAGLPEDERLVAVAWAHLLTDSIQEIVEHADAAAHRRCK